MFLSVITSCKGCFYDTEEMLIPKKLGVTCAGYSKLNRLDRMLPAGHRRRGYEV